MGRYLNKIAIAITIYLLSLGNTISPAQASSLLGGKYGYSLSNFNLEQSNSKNYKIINLLSGNLVDDTHDLSVNKINNSQDLQVALSQELDSLESVEKLNQQMQEYYQVILDEPTNVTQDETEQLLTEQLSAIPSAEKINQDLQAKYQDIIDEDLETISLLDVNKLLSSEDNLVGLEFAQSGDISIEQSIAMLQEQGLSEAEAIAMLQQQGLLDEEAIAMLQEQGLLDKVIGADQKAITFPFPLLMGFSLIIASIFAPVFIAVGKILEEEVVEGLQEKYGKPKVPEKAVTLHNKTFRELKTLANRASRIADEKFGSQEFILFIKLKHQVERGINEYQTIGQSIRYLEVAIAAQSSFLKLESTELRFRSRKQQEFYNFVADTILDEPDKDIFRDKVKKKLAQILPLLNSEEGRNALQSYLKEINEISKHDLGLQLFSLFKKYQLDDFTILRTVSDITQQLEAQDLFQLKGLIVLVLEYYNIFEKLAPIIGIPEEVHAPETYAKMMQYMGLVNRHSKAYQEFQLLLSTLKKWEKPYKSLKLIREQYSANEYRIPPQFTTELPGVILYQKYQKHLKSE